MDKTYYTEQLKHRFGNRAFVFPEYYRYPNGQDLTGKLIFTTKWATIGAGLFGLVNALVGSQKATFKEMSFQFFKPVVAAVGMAGAFTLTTYAATNLRQKDDSINYFLGGGAAGIMLGASLKSKPHGVFYFVVLGLLAARYKDFEHEPFFPTFVQETPGPHQVKVMDFSLTPYVKGNWTREKPVEE